MGQNINQEEIKWLFLNLRKVHFFADLTIRQIEHLINYFDKITYSPGDTIIKEGKPGKAFYIVYKGKVQIFKKEFLWKQKLLVELGPPSFFGEMSLLNYSLTSATVKAHEPVETFVLLREVFMRLMDENPELEKEIKIITEKRKLEQDTKK
jgi:CRP-like cAMP-binding protein